MSTTPKRNVCQKTGKQLDTHLDHDRRRAEVHNHVREQEKNIKKEDRFLEGYDRMKANAIFEKYIPSKEERAYAGYPTIKTHAKKFGYVTCAQQGELAANDPTSQYYQQSNMIGLGVDVFSTKEGHLHPGRVTIVTTHLKYLYRQKVKPEGHILDYHHAETGLDQHAMSDVTCTRAEMTKKLSKLISTWTIIFSFKPAEHLHLIKVVHFRIIDVRDLFKKDMEMGLLIDRMSLVRRYLSEDYYNLPEAVQAIALGLRYYAAFNWVFNVENEKNRPLFPMVASDEFDDKEIRSKQRLITNIHRMLSWRYRAYFIRPPTPILIGPKVIRVHVKKWSQLQYIIEFIEGLSEYIRAELPRDGPNKEYKHEEFRLLSLPISMKSKAQMKEKIVGFFAYIGFDDIERAAIAVEYFDKGEQKGDELVRYKCEKAIPRQAKSETEVSQKAREKKITKQFSVVGPIAKKLNLRPQPTEKTVSNVDSWQTQGGPIAAY